MHQMATLNSTGGQPLVVQLYLFEAKWMIGKVSALALVLATGLFIAHGAFADFWASYRNDALRHLKLPLAGAGPCPVLAVP
jgi:hypothetical protein